MGVGALYAADRQEQDCLNRGLSTLQSLLGNMVPSTSHKPNIGNTSYLTPNQWPLTCILLHCFFVEGGWGLGVLSLGACDLTWLFFLLGVEGLDIRISGQGIIVLFLGALALV